MGAALIAIIVQMLSGVLIVAGFIFIAGGALGLLRFPDFYTRLHAVSTSDGLGAVLVVAGLAIGAPPAVGIKLALLAALLIALAPTMTHVAANAAHAAGLAPLAGPYVAPRPGQPRRDPGA
jgi:multicomponent Na+:H+ antiporter subunit G